MQQLYKLLLFFLVMPNIGLAQMNLVPNPSFEEMTHCPVVGDTILCAGWSSYRISPDYYNACANSLSSNFGVPTNSLGYQQPKDGVAYIGLITFSSGGPSTYSIREFIGSKLLQPIVPGVRYFVSGYFSRTVGSNEDLCSTNKMGFKFSTRPYSYSNSAPIDNNAQVFYNEVITDTVEWTKVQGSFIADSAYEYVMIGNFFDNANTEVTGCNTTVGAVDAYYFIDNVCVSTDSLTCEVTTAVSPVIRRNSVTVFPNPAQDFVNIILPELAGSSSITVYDALGKQILHTANQTQSVIQLNLAQAKPGLLLVQINYKNQVYQYKIVKQ